MTKEFIDAGIKIVSGGTENHLMLIDVYSSFGLTGKEAEKILENIGISTNKNMIPFDTRKPLDPSGIRIGTPAITTRGFNTKECRALAKIMIEALKNPQNIDLQKNLKQQVLELCEKFPIPSNF